MSDREAVRANLLLQIPADEHHWRQLFNRAIAHLDRLNEDNAYQTVLDLCADIKDVYSDFWHHNTSWRSRVFGEHAEAWRGDQGAERTILEDEYRQGEEWTPPAWREE